VPNYGSEHSGQNTTALSVVIEKGMPPGRVLFARAASLGADQWSIDGGAWLSIPSASGATRLVGGGAALRPPPTSVRPAVPHGQVKGTVTEA
jgi:hypothetical protein